MPDGFSSSGESDIRFQFEVIKNLAESGREVAKSVERLTNTVGDVQKTQINMLERLAKIEANRVNETVAKLEERCDRQSEKIDKLESDKDQRDGGNAMRRALTVWAPLVLAGISALGWILRVAGLLHLPTDPPVPK